MKLFVIRIFETFIGNVNIILILFSLSFPYLFSFLACYAFPSFFSCFFYCFL